MRVTEFNKATVSGLASIMNILVSTMADNVIDMTEREHLATTVLSVALGLAAVYWVPNAKKKDKPNA